MKRDFLSLTDLSGPETSALIDRAVRLKAGATPRSLAGKSVGLIFAKSSTRTRVSFEVGAHRLGAHPVFLSVRELQLGRGEPMRDTARVLDRYLDALVIRAYAHAEARELAGYSRVPVINGLTDLVHPCQALADLMTVREALGGYEDKVVAWVGDGNNVANSWIEAAGLLGFELRLACPEGYEPDHQLFAAAAARSRVTLTEDPEEAVAGAHVVTTDVWASMGHEADAARRQAAFQGYSVTPELMAGADRNALFLHCLPAHRGEEVAESVLEGPQSRVWEEAENRMWVQMALLEQLCAGK